VEKHIKCSSRGSGKSAYEEGGCEVVYSLNTLVLVRCKTFNR
jgi:hypothetical protein